MTMLTQLPHSSPTRLALLAVSKRDAALLQLLTERFLSREFVIVPAGQANMALIDGDAASGREAVLEWQRDRPAAPMAILTLRPQADADGVAYVPKPINVEALIKVMRRLSLWRGSRTAVAVAAAEARPAPQPRNPPVQFPRPIVISAGRNFTPLASIDANAAEGMVSVEICMSSDPIVCLAAVNSPPAAFGSLKSMPAHRASAGF